MQKCLLLILRVVKIFFRLEQKELRGSVRIVRKVGVREKGRSRLRTVEIGAAYVEANLLASTRLSAPIKVGCAPRVDPMMVVEGNPRQMLS